MILQTAPILKIINERNSSDSNEVSESEIFTENRYCDNSSVKKTNDRVTNGSLECDNGTNVNDSDETSGENDENKDDAVEEQEMLNLLESRLQFILKSLIKQCSSSPK